jgi:RNA polymerase sigma-70 factor (ECF subfamily)
MTRYAEGDLQAFEQLYARHKQPSFRYFLRQLPRDSALDCHQELWMKLVRSANRYKAKGKFVALLYTIAHNVLTDHYRRNKKHLLLDTFASSEDLDLASVVPDLDQQLANQQLRSRLINLVGNLPHAQREVFVMREDCGLTIHEIAQITGSNEEGIKSRLRYAMQKLKSGMQKYV